jgi:hypothetical protein
MTKKETMAAARPMAMLATAILCTMEEKLSSVPWRSLFEMKYETFKECLNLKITDYKVKENAQDT